MQNKEFYNFLKKNLTYLILFCICSYILIHINNKCKNKTVLLEIKILYYILAVSVLLMINNIMDSPQEDSKKLVGIFAASVILITILNYVIDTYYISDKFYIKMLICMGVAFGIFAISAVYYYFKFKTKDDLQLSFINAYNKNSSFLIFLIVMLYIFYLIFSAMYSDTALSDILTPTILGIPTILYLFGFIIFFANKIGLINSYQYLNTFIVLSSITFLLGIFYLYFFMSSLNSVCDGSNAPPKEEKDPNKEVIILLTLGTIIGFLWLDDTRNWHQIGYIAFIVLSIFAYYIIFTYSTLHPSLSMISTWLLIEWLILLFYKKADSKNSLQFAFMKT